MKIFDCFLFNGEVEMLKLRLEELSPVVDYFIIGEASETFRGQGKTRVLPEIGMELIPFKDKIRTLEIPVMPPTKGERPEAWLRQEFQRNYLARGFEDAADKDLILISDVDEIIRADAVRSLQSCEAWLQEHKKVRFGQQFHYYYFNCLVEASLQPWPLAVGVLARRVRATSCEFERFAERMGAHDENIILRGGWHFSWFGSNDDIRRKFESISDDTARAIGTISVEQVGTRRSQGTDIMERNINYHFTDGLPDLPAGVMRGLEYYRRLGWVHV